jgi:hypothetical protein
VPVRLFEQSKVVKFNDGVVKGERDADEVLIQGEELSRDGSGRVVSKVQLFDRVGDRYLERVVDFRTGERLRPDQDHPLSEHQGHGSDR